MCFGMPRASLRAGPVFREPNEARAACAADFVGLSDPPGADGNDTSCAQRV